MSLSDTDKTVIEVSAFTTLDNTGDFLYINADVDDENNFKIWYIPKIADSDATATRLEKSSAYMLDQSGLIQIYQMHISFWEDRDPKQVDYIV